MIFLFEIEILCVCWVVESGNQENRKKLQTHEVSHMRLIRNNGLYFHNARKKLQTHEVSHMRRIRNNGFNIHNARKKAANARSIITYAANPDGISNTK